MRDIINHVVNRLESLNGGDFHSYRSEAWNVVADAIREATTKEKQRADDYEDALNRIDNVESSIFKIAHDVLKKHKGGDE